MPVVPGCVPVPAAFVEVNHCVKFCVLLLSAAMRPRFGAVRPIAAGDASALAMRATARLPLLIFAAFVVSVVAEGANAVPAVFMQLITPAALTLQSPEIAGGRPVVCARAGCPIHAAATKAPRVTKEKGSHMAALRIAPA